jgi:ribonuclease HII
MVFLAGIDEAGYGPFVGPLTMGYSLLRMPKIDCDLWEILSTSTARKPDRKDLRRLWLDDSKKVHQGTLGRGRLERTVAAFRELVAPGRAQFDDWLSEPPAGDMRSLHAAPWFQKLDGPLCPSIQHDRARLDSAALHRDLETAGCAVQAFGARAVPAGEWNELLQSTGGKGSANFAVAMEIVRHLLAITGDAPLRIELDRHGARMRYADVLRNALDPLSIEIHGERPSGSTYSLKFPTRSVQLRFSEGADSTHMPVALGSLAAKQTRERLMDEFNLWWTQRLPDLKPTKGYGVDGKRWLAEVLPQLKETGVDRAILRRDR